MYKKYNIEYNLSGGSSSNNVNENVSENFLYTDSLDVSGLLSDINQKNYDVKYYYPEDQWLEEVKEGNISNSYQIPLGLAWEKIKLSQQLNFKIEDYEKLITFNTYKLTNSDDIGNKKLIILPGFSSDSFGWTISRISKYHQIIFNQGFKEIHVFDFTGIGGRKDDKTIPQFNIQSDVIKKFPDISNIVDVAYIQISKFLTDNIFDQHINYSILGRSAGGGLALNMVFSCGLEPNGLNLAAPGIDFQQLAPKIEQFMNKSIPIRLCSTNNDKKVPLHHKDGSNNLANQIMNCQFIDFIFFVKSTVTNDDVINHRIQEILIKNLV
tara:strand:+ start:2260 stop:3231 length:972 start_codon:yes stop_codon:yes gene_type:complete